MKKFLQFIIIIFMASCANKENVSDLEGMAAAQSGVAGEEWPKLINGMCETRIATRSNDESGQVVDVVKTLVAFPVAEKGGCDTLKVGVDYFSKDAYGGDPYFLGILSRVKKWLDGIEKSQMYPLSPAVAEEILRTRMSALTGIFLSSKQPIDRDRYDVSFYLRETRRVVVISINDDGGNPEWGEIVD